jgi:hypothetical protein
MGDWSHDMSKAQLRRAENEAGGRLKFRRSQKPKASSANQTQQGACAFKLNNRRLTLRSSALPEKRSKGVGRISRRPHPPVLNLEALAPSRPIEQVQKC